MIIIWDEPKRRANLKRHGLDFADLDRFDWEGAYIEQTKRSIRGGRRFKAIGQLDEDTLVAIFSMLGTEAYSIVSLRPASQKERRLVS